MAGAFRRALSRAHFVTAALAGALFFLALSLAGILVALTSRVAARRAPVAFAHAFGAFMTAVLGWRIRAEGVERIDDAAPAVLVANHQSNLDIVTYGSIYPRGTVAVGKKELLKIPLFGWFFAVTGNVLLDRGDPASARASIDAAAERIKRERISVWMFPEGHRNGGPRLLPFKKGAFHLAIAAQVPVVPIVQEPLAAVLDAGRALVRPGEIRIRVLPPIPTDGLTHEDADALAERTRIAMQAARDELEASARDAIS
ncbi:MAG TPA: lysophospholipid acyltransferase family protein [Thermoanaerobaculia bacterium]|nr:lysophospholipid acyltransferase family protein [Thermoanaerobaculia bacterium]